MDKDNHSAFATIADIHGNSDALRAVLADIESLGISQIVNLGDHVSGPVAPRETADILMATRMMCIRGNHERWLLEKPVDDMGLADAVAMAELEPHHLAWLRDMPLTDTLDDDIFLCHGTPSSDMEYWLETVSPDGIVSMRGYDEIAAQATGLPQTLILCGHTHVRRSVRLHDGRLIVNPGSVGCPGYRDDTPMPHVVQAGTPDASYAILEKRDSHWHVTFRQVPYDTGRMVQMARDHGADDWAHRLATGWVNA